MDILQFTKKVKKQARFLGFDLVGVADASDSEFDRAPAGHKPVEYLPGARSVIVGGIEVIDEILQTTPSPMYAKHYDHINICLISAADKLTRFLCHEGFEAMWFPETDDYRYFHRQRAEGAKVYSPSFSHISAATAAGLGARGKVGVVLTPQFGPRQRWISVVSTAALIPDPKFDGELCLERIKPGSCGDKCIKACQSIGCGALKPWPEEGGVDMLACHFGKYKERGMACGVCIKVCPTGR
jgi:epoxyqueuosine reductase QueG